MSVETDSTGGGRRGRPPSPYAAQNFTLRLSPQLRQGVEQAARQQDMSVGEFTRDLLETYIERLHLRSG